MILPRWFYQLNRVKWVAIILVSIMRLFFIRHGQSENNALWVNTQSSLDRVSDPRLTETGKKQVKAAADYLKKLFNSDNHDLADPSIAFQGEVIHIYCSLMERAIESGLIIANKLSLPLHGHLDIHENGGLYLEDPLSAARMGEAGKSPDAFKKKYPDLILPDGINPEGWWSRPFEERETRRERAKKVVDDLIKRYGNSAATVIFISHVGFYNYFLRAILELKDVTEIWFDLNNAAITLFEINEGLIKLVYCNRSDFMLKDLVSLNDCPSGP